MQNDNKKVLITGISGYIGSNLAKHLLNQGWQVGGIIRKNTKLCLIEDAINDVELAIYDGTVTSLISFIGKFKPAVVYHLASCFLSEHRSEQVTELVDANILFGMHLLEAMEQSGVKKLINTGTAWQHYYNEQYNPVCLYAATKEAFEKIIDFYVDAHDFSVITLELFDTYGPNDPRKKVIPLFCRAALTKEQLLFSLGDQKLDLVYIDDVIAAYQKASKMLFSQEKIHAKYAIATQNPKSLKDIVKLFEDVFQVKLNVVWGGREYRKREVMQPWNNGVILPHWHPVYNLEDGLKKVSFQYNP
jgi:nucleoside-diphosphate-sugar epimerase